MERKWWTLVIVCVGVFMLLLDITIVNIALPDISRELGASFSDLQWVIDAYALTLAALMLTAGSLGDLLGHRLVLVVGLVVFSAGSLACGLARDPTLLIGARAVQGVGGAAMFACSLALIGRAFHGRDSGIALGAWGATAGAAIALGPLIGGALTSGVSWRWVFLVNVPIGVAAVAGALARVGETDRKPDVRPDLPGFVLLGGALLGLVYGLIRGNADGWASAGIVAAFAGGAALLVAFLIVERRTAQPMLDLSLLRVPAVVGASIGVLAVSATLYSMFLYLTLYLQDVQGYSPFGTGLRFLPVSALVLVAAPISGRASQRVPTRYAVAAGLALVGAGLLWMTRVTPASGWTVLLPGFILGGLGSGMLNPALASTAIGTVRRDMAGVGSGINNTFRQIGVAVGIAGLGAIFQDRVRAAFVPDLVHRAPRLADRASALAGSISQGGGTASAGDGPAARAIQAAARSAFVAGLDRILWVAGIGAIVGAVLALALIRPRDFHGSPEQQESSIRRPRRDPILEEA